MTALQDWLTLRPVDQGLREMVFRPLRAALSAPATAAHRDGIDTALMGFTLQRPGIERC